MTTLRQRSALADDARLIAAIAESEHISELTARLITRRGVCSVAAAASFLHPSETLFLDPYLLPGMDKAVTRIRRSVETGELICIYGDYDADGVCAAAILVGRLRRMGANVTCYIPDRHNEGYGLNEAAVRKLHRDGVRLIVTVDNGISAFQEIALCGALGIDVVVSDHHSAGSALPDCEAVVSASRKDNAYPNASLCGAGVAFKIVQALTDDAYSDEELALAAVATVADVVPLTDENRSMIVCGMRHIKDSLGLSALLKAAAWKQPVSDQAISFCIAPRLNAVGRVSSALFALELLLCADEEKANALALRLEEDNRARKELENGILADAARMIEETGRPERAILLAHDGWNAGVIGIVASRLCETYHIPVILFSEKDGVLTGSGRSIGKVNLYENLSLFSDLFERFGGHARAAGVTMRAEHFDSFCEAFLKRMYDAYTEEDFCRVVEYDETIPLDALTLRQAHELERIAPFGDGNPEPCFRFEQVRFASPRPMGKDAKHFCANVVQEQSVMRVVSFGRGDLSTELRAGTFELAARVSINAYRGEESVELMFVCANPFARNSNFFNAFFEELMYNGFCSDDKIAEWCFSIKPFDPEAVSDEAMRRMYRSLRTRLGGRGETPKVLESVLTREEQFALCVFAELGFFSMDAGSGAVKAVENCEPKKLICSALYRRYAKQREE